jgi:hypothetical protein
MKAPTFTFVPEELLSDIPQEGSDGLYKVTLTSNNQLYFNKETLEIYDLKNKFIKMHADKSKKALGWSILEDNIGDVSKLKNIRQLIPDKKYGKGLVSVKKLLIYMGVKTEVTRPKMPVYVYRDQVNKKDVYYIMLNELVNDKKE